MASLSCSKQKKLGRQDTTDILRKKITIFKHMDKTADVNISG